MITTCRRVLYLSDPPIRTQKFPPWVHVLTSMYVYIVYSFTYMYVFISNLPEKYEYQHITACVFSVSHIYVYFL